MGVAAVAQVCCCNGVPFDSFLADKVAVVGPSGRLSGGGDPSLRGVLPRRLTPKLLPLRHRAVTGPRANASGSSSTFKDVKFERGTRERVGWAGDGPLAGFVSSLISIGPLFSIMKIGAKNVMIRTAEKNGIPWRQIVDDFKSSNVYAEKDLLENLEISYPDSTFTPLKSIHEAGNNENMWDGWLPVFCCVDYTKQFHAYDEGNLSWEAAFEVEPATMALMKRTIPSSASPQEAGDVVRSRWRREIESHHAEFSGGPQARAVLDVGCSTGTSSRSLRDGFPDAQITGLDLSPYFLAVAQQIEKQEAMTVPRERRIQYIHANAEATGLPSKSFDIVSLSFVLHECPRQVTANILKEAHRLLRPGGTISIIETSPKSKTIQSLPPPLYVLMKATEPWLDEFFMLNLEDELKGVGFTNIRSVLTSPRHSTTTATAA